MRTRQIAGRLSIHPCLHMGPCSTFAKHERRYHSSPTACSHTRRHSNAATSLPVPVQRMVVATHQHRHGIHEVAFTIKLSGSFATTTSCALLDVQQTTTRVGRPAARTVHALSPHVVHSRLIYTAQPQFAVQPAHLVCSLWHICATNMVATWARLGGALCPRVTRSDGSVPNALVPALQGHAGSSHMMPCACLATAAVQALWALAAASGCTCCPHSRAGSG